MTTILYQRMLHAATVQDWDTYISMWDMLLDTCTSAQEFKQCYDYGFKIAKYFGMYN